MFHSWIVELFKICLHKRSWPNQRLMAQNLTAQNNHHDASFLWYILPASFSKLPVANTFISCTAAILASFNYSPHTITKLAAEQTGESQSMYNQVFGYIKSCLLRLVKKYLLYYITSVVGFIFAYNEITSIAFCDGLSAIFQFCCKFSSRFDRTCP